MIELTIESNGRLELTAVYINGEQLTGIKELFLNLDEDGTFDSIIKYVDLNDQEFTRNIFSDELTNIQVKDAAFTEEEANNLQAITITSDGFIDNTDLYWNDENLDGVVSLFAQIKTPEKDKSKFGIFGKDKTISNSIVKAEITFRNEDDSIETETVF